MIPFKFCDTININIYLFIYCFAFFNEKEIQTYILQYVVLLIFSLLNNKITIEKIIKSHVNSSGYVWNITIPSTDPAFAIIDSNWAVFEITAEIISTELLGLGLWESIFLIVCILCVNYWNFICVNHKHTFIWLYYWICKWCEYIWIWFLIDQFNTSHISNTKQFNTYYFQMILLQNMWWRWIHTWWRWLIDWLIDSLIPCVWKILQCSKVIN